MLESTVARANAHLIEYNLILGVVNVGSLFRKAKLFVPLLYYETSSCRKQIESLIDKDALVIRNQLHVDRNNKINFTSSNNKKTSLDYDKLGIKAMKDECIDVTADSRSKLATKIILKYSQRWISLFDKRKLNFSDNTSPRHLSTGKCLCQFIEEHFSTINDNFTNSFDNVSNNGSPISCRLIDHSKMEAPLKKIPSSLTNSIFISNAAAANSDSYIIPPASLAAFLYYMQCNDDIQVQK